MHGTDGVAVNQGPFTLPAVGLVRAMQIRLANRPSGPTNRPYLVGSLRARQIGADAGW
jgi:hypothetical protein